ncbi:MAG: STAS domain-containing protein [Micromonosporaceae bacterium]|nr:STAS domain-containing protein [Micromonosporaceae bacterium]
MGTPRFDHMPDPSRSRSNLLTHTTVREDVQRVRICFSGEIDLSSADLVDAAIIDALRSHRPRRLEIDLSGLRFMDSSGVSALIRGRAKAIDGDCQLVVTDASPMIYRILNVTGVLRALADVPGPEQPEEG